MRRLNNGTRENGSPDAGDTAHPGGCVPMGGKTKRPPRLKEIWSRTAVIIVSLWAVFILLTLFCVQRLQRKNLESKESLLAFAATQVDDSLDMIEDFLKVTLINDSTFVELRNSSLNRPENLREASVKMENYGQFFVDFSGIFYYEEETDILMVQWWRDILTSTLQTSEIRMDMRETLRELCSAEDTSQEWEICQVNGIWIAIYAYQYQDQYLGTFLKLDALLENTIALEEIDGFESAYLIDEEGRSLTGETDVLFQTDQSLVWMEKKAYFQMSSKIDGLSISILSLLPWAEVMESLLVWWLGVALVVMLSGLVLYILLGELRKNLIVPIYALSEQMRQVSEGVMNPS